MNIEKRLIQKLDTDFGEAGLEYLEVKKKAKGITNLNSITHYAQKRFIIELCHGLYDEIEPGNKFREFILNLFINLYGFTEAEESVIWRDYFKGIPPINFLNFFFGKTVGNNLKKIEENRIRVNNVNFEDDPVQFSFIINLIGRIFKNYPFLKNIMNSIFTKYVLYGEEKSKIKFKDFVIANNVEETLFSFKGYLMENMNNENMKDIQDVIGIIDLTKDVSFTKSNKINKKSGVGIKIKRNIETKIKGELGKYINQEELSYLIKSAKKSANITDFASANSKEKEKFLNKILENSSVTSSSFQRENLIRNWMNRILDI